jgi:polar amino acid transport system substrate-binding protein
VKSRHRLGAVAAIIALGGLGLAGCGSSDTPGPATNAAGVALVKDGKLTVCTHLPYAPFQSNDDSGKTVGFDVDLMDLVAKKLGVEQAIVDTPFEGIKSGQDMSTGKCDIAAAGMTITEERQKAILFSDPYFDATQALLVPNGSSFASLAELKGKKLGAQSATTGLDYAKKHQEENGYEVVEFQDLASETQALLTGQVDAAINDLPVWSEVIKQNEGKATIATQFDTGEQYGFGMKLGNDALKKVVDETLAGAKSDGTYESTFKKWIGEVPKA